MELAIKKERNPKGNSNSHMENKLHTQAAALDLIARVAVDPKQDHLREHVYCSLPSWFPWVDDEELAPPRTVELPDATRTMRRDAKKLDCHSLWSAVFRIPWQLRDSPCVVSIIYDASKVDDGFTCCSVGGYSDAQQVLYGDIRPLLDAMAKFHSSGLRRSTYMTAFTLACVFGSRPLIQLIMLAIEKTKDTLIRDYERRRPRTILHYLATFPDQSRAIDIINMIRKRIETCSNDNLRNVLIDAVTDPFAKAYHQRDVDWSFRLHAAVAECAGHHETARALKRWRGRSSDAQATCEPTEEDQMKERPSEQGKCDCHPHWSPICLYHARMQQQQRRMQQERQRLEMTTAASRSTRQSAESDQIANDILAKVKDCPANSSRSQHILTVMAETVEKLADTLQPVVLEGLVELLGREKDVISLHTIMDAGKVPPSVAPRCGQLVLQLMRDSENEIRQLHEWGIDHDPTAGLFDVYDGSEENPFGGKWSPVSWDAFEQYFATYCDDHADDCRQLTDGRGLPFTLRDKFQHTFDKFTRGVFYGYDWQGTVVVGGSVVASLSAPWDSPVEDHFNAFGGADIDVYFYGAENLREKCEDLFDTVVRNIKHQGIKKAKDICIVSGSNTVTLIPGYPYRPIQVIMKQWNNISEVVTTTDLDATGAGFDGNTVWMTPRGFLSYRHRWNTVDVTKYEIRGVGRYERRLAKYAKRGFRVVDVECRRDQREEIRRRLMTEAQSPNPSNPWRSVKYTKRGKRGRLVTDVQSRNPSTSKLHGAALLTQIHYGLGSGENDDNDGGGGGGPEFSECGSVDYPWKEMSSDTLYHKLQQFAFRCRRVVRIGGGYVNDGYASRQTRKPFTVYRGWPNKRFLNRHARAVNSKHCPFPTKAWLEFLSTFETTSETRP